MIHQEEIERDYIDAKKAGEMLKLSPSRISRLCSGGRFKGAFKNGASWLIPLKAVLEHEPLTPGPKPQKPVNGKETLERVLEELKKSVQ